jgi:hypothetical protein
VPVLKVTDSGALVAGPSVSISPTIPPLALSRLTSPEAEEEFRKVRQSLHRVHGFARDKHRIPHERRYRAVPKAAQALVPE